MVWFWNHYLASDEDGTKPYASPLQAKRFNFPPKALVITAEFDPLRDEGEAYGAKLKEMGADVTVSRYNGMIHGFFSLPNLDQCAAARKEAADSLRAALAQ